MKICVLFVGKVQDAGFNACALRGADHIASWPDVVVEIVGDVPFEADAMRTALTGAASRNDAVIFIGGQGNAVVPDVAQAHPKASFAVVQGDVSGPNLASYEVLQEQSAFLAGCLAAQLTQTGIVGHLSGHRVTPGLKGRAAYVAGVQYVDPKVRVLTGFCGTQDDNEIAKSWALAEIEKGADLIFTMLNGAREGVIDACRHTGTRQIGNVLDWVETNPDDFVASAIAQIDLAVRHAAADLITQHVPSNVEAFGLAEGAVTLSLGEQVPAHVTEHITKTGELVAAGKVGILTRYQGPEFKL